MALSGTLDSFALPDVMRLLASTKKTGRLRVTGNRGSGSVWVDDGEIVSTELTLPGTADPTPPEVVFGLLRFGSGSFTFEAEARAVNAGPPEPLEPVLVSAEHMLTEWRAIEEIVPSLDVHVTLTPEPTGGDVMIDTPRWRCIAAVGGGATAGAVGAALGQGEIEVCRTIKELVELGLLEIGEAPAEVEPTPAPFVADLIAPEPIAAEPTPRDPAPADPSFEPDLATSELGVDEPSAAADEPSAGVDGTSEDEDDDDSFADAGAMDSDSGDSLEADWSEPTETIVTTAPGLAGLDAVGRGYEPEMLSADGPATSADPDGDAAADDSDPEPESSLEPAAPADIGSSLFGAADEAEEMASELDPAEMARQLANLSPKAAKAVAAAAKASTDAERDAALAAVEAEDETVNRGLLLKFLGSVDG